ncbi:MAG: hypothetical protein ACJ75B_20100 [Flavisolibacter sp.]
MKTKSIFFATVFFMILCQAYSQVSAPSIETSFQNYLRSSSGSINTGSVLPTFLVKENTRGNRYFSETWLEGSVTGVNGVVYNSPKFKYNYDKISRKLFMLLDSSTVVELSSGDIAGFELKTDGGILVFERLKNSTDLNFYQPVYKDEKGYSLYKLLTTKFNRADYQSNGIIESGNKYDEYVDTKEYFILSSKGELTKIIFKKKAIEKALENESSKVEAFFSSHKSDAIDESFVKNLLESLNPKQ